MSQGNETNAKEPEMASEHANNEHVEPDINLDGGVQTPRES